MREFPILSQFPAEREIHEIEIQLANLCLRIHALNRTTPHCHDVTQPASMELRERHDRHMATRRLVVFLRGTQCGWATRSGGCVYCGFFKAANAGQRVEANALYQQIDQAYELYRLHGADAVGLYNDGNYFNPDEIDPDIQRDILKRVSRWPGIKQITVESRSEYLNLKVLPRIREDMGNCSLEIATGIDSTSESTVRLATNRGVKVDSCLRIMDDVMSMGIRTTALLVFKLPFFFETEAILDAQESINDLLKEGIPVDIECMTIQPGSLVAYLWQLGYYRPPWLWSIVELLRRLPALDNVYVSPFRYSVENMAGPFNCAECSVRITQALTGMVERSRDKALLPEITPCCGDSWQEMIARETGKTMVVRAREQLDDLRSYLDNLPMTHGQC